MKSIQVAFVSLSLMLGACNSVVLIDSAPPTVTVSSPAESTTATYLFKGTLKDNVGIKSAHYQFNGAAPQPLTWNAQGEFQVSLTLRPGENTLVVEASDARGNITTRTLKIQYDPPAPVDVTPPVVTVTSATTADAESYMLQGSIADLSGIQSSTYQLNGGAVQPLQLNSEGKFVVMLTLRQGLNSIVVKATDNKGNTTTISHSVQVADLMRPSIQFTSPATSTTSSYTFTGTVTDNVELLSASYQVNGGPLLPLPVDSTGRFSVQVSLVPGQNSLQVVASDAVGQGTMTLSVLYEAPEQVPVLVELYPAQGIEAGGSQVTLKGTSLTSTTEVRMDGVSVPFEVKPSGDLSFTSPEHTRGTVQVTVTNPAGTSNPLTFKYVPFGIWQFAASIDFTWNSLVADAQNNFFVALRQRIWKLDPRGKRLWEWTAPATSQLDMGSLKVDAENNLYVCATVSGDFLGTSGYRSPVLFKLSPQGQPLWARRLDVSDVPNCTDIAFDDSGNVYAAGLSWTNMEVQQYSFLAKFTSSGGALWSRTFGIELGMATQTVAIDGGGNVQVAGYQRAKINNTDAHLAIFGKFDAQGNLLGLKPSKDLTLSGAYDLVFNSKNEAYVIYYRYGSGSYVLQKQDSEGQVLWSREGPRSGLQLDVAENIYGHNNNTLYKYAPDGTVLLEKRQPALDGVTGISIVRLLDGNFYLSGTTRGNVGGYVNPDPNTDQVVLAKLDSNWEITE